MESTLNPSPVRPIDNKPKINKNVVLSLVAVVVVLLGIGTGYLISGKNKETPEIGTTGEIKVDKNEAGVIDESEYPDTAEGILEEGGIQGEGTYHLVRGIGPSQYAYLTSSVVDMSSFVGKKVKIWGQTLSGKKAGWLLDVGKIKVIE